MKSSQFNSKAAKNACQRETRQEGKSETIQGKVRRTLERRTVEKGRWGNFRTKRDDGKERCNVVQVTQKISVKKGRRNLPWYKNPFRRTTVQSLGYTRGILPERREDVNSLVVRSLVTQEKLCITPVRGLC